jgi:hypothetical protein
MYEASIENTTCEPSLVNPTSPPVPHTSWHILLGDYTRVPRKTDAEDHIESVIDDIQAGVGQHEMHLNIREPPLEFGDERSDQAGSFCCWSSFPPCTKPSHASISSMSHC